MKINMILLVVFTAIVSVLSIYLLDNILIGSLVAFLIVIFLFITPQAIFFVNKMSKWSKLLFVDCDPIAFIALGNKHLESKRFNQFFIKINLSAGYIESGEFETAKGLLCSVDLNNPDFNKPATKLVYYNNLMMCYLGLNQIEEAISIYENQIKPLRLSGKQLLTKGLAESIYLFYIGQYDESKLLLQNNLNAQKGVNNYLNILYFLALINIKQDQFDAAKVKLIEIIQKGNKLKLVKDAKVQLKSLA